MGKTNVVILNSDRHTSSMAFDNLTSFVQFVGLFVDDHNGWDRLCDMIIVHKNNQVVRYRFRKLQELVDFTMGIQVAGWLSTDEGSEPALNYQAWVAEDFVTKQYDSRTHDAIMADLGHIPKDGVNEEGYDSFDDEGGGC